MASTSSAPEIGPMTLDDLGRDIARRTAEYEARTGKAFVMRRNAGNRRTDSKKALLAAIDAASEEQGWRW
jgi:hypothetical protein